MQKQIDLSVPLQQGDKEIARLTLRKPASGELRGLKMLDVLQMDPSAHAQLVPRICEEITTAAEFWALDSADLMTVMGTVVSFFGTSSMESPMT